MPETTQQTDLLPCPFCGGEATLRYDGLADLHGVQRFTCGEVAQDGFTEVEAITAWNTRPQ